MSFLRFPSHFRFRLNFQSCHVTSTKSKKKKGAKSEMHIPYRDSVLTWLLRENLGKIIYPKHAIKTKMKGFFSNFHGQNKHKIELGVHCTVLTKKLINPIFSLKWTKQGKQLQIIVTARIYSQCLWYLGYITQKKTQTSMSCEDGCRALSKD